MDNEDFEADWIQWEAILKKKVTSPPHTEHLCCSAQKFQPDDVTVNRLSAIFLD